MKSTLGRVQNDLNFFVFHSFIGVMHRNGLSSYCKKKPQKIEKNEVKVTGFNQNDLKKILVYLIPSYFSYKRNLEIL